MGDFDKGIVSPDRSSRTDRYNSIASRRSLGRLVRLGGKSEHGRTRWWVTPTDPLQGQGQCHREQTARAGQPAQVRVKRCGKSAPPGR
jgi:hypothetical protein